MSQRVQPTTWSLLLWGVLGLVAGGIMAVVPVHACSCGIPGWSLALQEVSSSSADVDHTEYWASTAFLQGGDSYFWFDGGEIGSDQIQHLVFEAEGRRP